MTEFAVGDTVIHKSGGPDMIVTYAGTHYLTNEPSVGARWWDGKEFKVESFGPFELTKK